MLTATPGSIVTCRNRQWILLPSKSSELIHLRPLSGGEDEIVGIFDPLELEKISPAQFPNPRSTDFQDHESAQLLLDAARFSLRSGAGPFRCFGKLSVQPRPFQIVPLLMALRLNTVRLLIADDVGIGKTVEAGLIARELLDRGEIQRIAILCPPHLCDQWHQELKDKFNVDATIVRSGTVSQLERGMPSGNHIFSYYQHLIVSLDYVKSERRRAEFVSFCPDFVIVDEVHTCTAGNSAKSGQQQRYKLLHGIAQSENRHLVLLTATPHSGIETSFLSLLGLLNPKFENLDVEHLSETERQELAKHFIQRRRADVSKWLGDETPFPERNSYECDYQLSKGYRQLFEQVYNFALGLIRGTNEQMSYGQRRGRYWSALALIRCVMSSPAAAIATLIYQLSKRDNDALPFEMSEDFYAAYVDDPTEVENVVDMAPTAILEQGQQAFVATERKTLRSFITEAEALKGKNDSKLNAVIELVISRLEAGLNPIIWCRYIATADYVAQALRQKLNQSKVRVVGITGALSDSERDLRLAEVGGYPQRVLVSTDCLSEGVNLQDKFSVVIHYDLPWNPNRLEQREGRVDRYGQVAPIVESYLLYGRDNPVDGAVLDVLIRKAVKIHRSLGITVPVPMDSVSVSETVFQSLFAQSSTPQQLSLLEELEMPDSRLGEIHRSWERAVERDRVSRTRFAQHSIKPAEVERELLEMEQVLGNCGDVERFVKSACDRLSAPLQRKKNGWYMAHIPEVLQPILGSAPRTLCFQFPALEGTEYIGRNHPLVEGLASFLLEQSLMGQTDAIAARCSYTLTHAVEKRTTILLMRLRHVLIARKQNPLMAEECFVVGFTGSPSNPSWLAQDVVNTLLADATPSGDLSSTVKEKELADLLDRLDELQPGLEKIAVQRAEGLAQSHQRVRLMTQAGKVKVKPQLPMDILGIYILQPN